MAVSPETSSEKMRCWKLCFKTFYAENEAFAWYILEKRDVEIGGEIARILGNGRFAWDILHKMECRRSSFRTSFLISGALARDILENCRYRGTWWTKTAQERLKRAPILSKSALRRSKTHHHHHHHCLNFNHHYHWQRVFLVNNSFRGFHGWSSFNECP